MVDLNLIRLCYTQKFVEQAHIRLELEAGKVDNPALLRESAPLELYVGSIHASMMRK